MACPRTPHHPEKLPDVPEEVETLETLWKSRQPSAVKRVDIPFEGTPAESGAAVSAWDRYGVLHLACHGEFPGVADDPFDAALLLGRDKVRASEFFTTRLSARVACLSACAVGRRAEHYAGLDVVADEWIGLHLPLFYAGARCVLSSMWDANSEIARDFMAAFHAALVDESPDQAYRKAINTVADWPEQWWANWYLAGFPE